MLLIQQVDVMEFQQNYSKTLKDDTITVFHSIPQQIWKAQHWPQDQKKSILISTPKKSSIKECGNHRTTALISHVSKIMIKILHAQLQHYASQELPDVQAGFRKGRGTRDQIANIFRIIEKAREFQKTFTSISSTMPKPLTVWIVIHCEKLLKRWEFQTILPVTGETCMLVKKQQLNPCMEKLICSRLRKEYIRAVCYHPVYLIYMLSTS